MRSYADPVAATSPSSSAQQAREALADQLRELRSDAGLTAKALAAATGWDRWKVSKIEHATRAPSVRDVRAWCRACGADELAEDLVATLRAVESAYVEWRRLQRGGLRRLQDASVPLYERTRVMQVYCSHVVPGLLQTAEYAHALLTAITEHHGTRNDVDDAVVARIERQRVLREPGHRFVFVVEEAALRYCVGDDEVMAQQLKHLRSAMSLPSVALLVVPFSVARAQWPLENFTIYDGEHVRVELLSAQVNITAPHEVAWYVKAFGTLTGSAVTGERARDLISAALP